MTTTTDIPQGLSAAYGWLVELAALFSPFGTDSRLHWTGLSAFLALGFAVFLFERKRRGAKPTSFLGFLLPMDLYKTQSSWVDVKVYFAGRVLKPLITAVAVPVNAAIMTASAGLAVRFTSESEPAQPDTAMIVLASLIVALLFDFSYYVTHRVSHESELLWPFHKLHHSAEVLTPITAKRNHPVFDMLLGLVRIAMIAPVAGIVFGLFGVVEFTTIFGLTVLVALMNVTGGALRHSHIWLDFGPVLDRIFISPAQHQIHHSTAPRHHDKNYGLTLAIWDWMFGTLYVPKGREDLAFGVADPDGTPQPQVHRDLKEAYLVPFEEAAGVIRKRANDYDRECA